MNIKITADSTCDLSQDLIQKYDIAIVPLFVIKEGEEFLDGLTITPAEIFDHVAKGGNLCSTSAQSVGTYQDVFEKYAGSYEGVIHFSIGAEFSSSYQNAVLAAEEFDNVRVIDTRSLSGGQGLVALKGAMLAPDAASLDALVEDILAYREKVEGSFVIDKLDYLAKGGRCSSLMALGANLLNLKPCIEMRDGKLMVGKKYRGHFDKCLLNYIKDRLDGRDDIDTSHALLIWTVVPDETISAVREAVRQYGHFDTVTEVIAGCTISCHCGPGTLGILFAKK